MVIITVVHIPTEVSGEILESALTPFNAIPRFTATPLCLLRYCLSLLHSSADSLPHMRCRKNGESEDHKWIASPRLVFLCMLCGTVGPGQVKN